MISAFTVGDSVLPPGQKPIRTSSVDFFITFMNLIRDPERAYPTMGLVTGPAGIGKTIAIQAYLESLRPLAHTGLRPTIQIEVPTGCPATGFSSTIVTALQGRLHGGRIPQTAFSATEAILRNDLDCLVVDEANRLDTDTFDMLRYLFDRTGCPVVLVGLPRIESVINRYEKFRSRIGLRMTFCPLNKEEIFGVLLPNLIFGRWEFDPEDEKHLEMGEFIYGVAEWSLRTIRELLQTADQVAEKRGKPRITLDHLKEADELMRPPDDNRQDRGNRKGGPYEQDSEDRYDARNS
jgi:hypothetical protein